MRFSKEKRIAQTARAREAALKARKRRKAAAKLQAKDQQELGYRLSSLHLSPQQMEPCQGDQSGSSKNNKITPTVSGSPPNNTEAALPISKEHCQPEHTSTNASPSHLQRTDTLVVEYIRPRIVNDRYSPPDLEQAESQEGENTVRNIIRRKRRAERDERRNTKKFYEEGERIKGTLIFDTPPDLSRVIVAYTVEEWVARYDKAWSLIEDTSLISEERKFTVKKFPWPVPAQIWESVTVIPLRRDQIYGMIVQFMKAKYHGNGPGAEQKEEYLENIRKESRRYDFRDKDNVAVNCFSDEVEREHGRGMAVCVHRFLHIYMKWINCGCAAKGIECECLASLNLR